MLFVECGGLVFRKHVVLVFRKHVHKTLPKTHETCNSVQESVPESDTPREFVPELRKLILAPWKLVVAPLSLILAPRIFLLVPMKLMVNCKAPSVQQIIIDTGVVLDDFDHGVERVGDMQLFFLGKVLKEKKHVYGQSPT